MTWSIRSIKRRLQRFAQSGRIRAQNRFYLVGATHHFDAKFTVTGDIEIHHAALLTGNPHLLGDRRDFINDLNQIQARHRFGCGCIRRARGREI